MDSWSFADTVATMFLGMFIIGIIALLVGVVFENYSQQKTATAVGFTNLIGASTLLVILLVITMIEKLNGWL